MKIRSKLVNESVIDLWKYDVHYINKIIKTLII